MKTTIYGIATIVAGLANAAVALINTGTFDIAILIAAITAGIGLIQAQDQKP